ncbi:MAG: glycosyltransferase [Actinomycetota bacterium]
MTVTLARAEAPEVSVLIVTYGGWDLARQALEAVRDHTRRPSEVIVVDNASPDGTGERLRTEVRGATVVLNGRNVGFGPAVNQAAALARGRYLALLNSDALVRPGWLEPLVERLQGDPTVGAVVSRLLNADGTVQEAGSLLWSDGSTLAFGAGAAGGDPAYRFARTVDYGSAACLLIRRSVFLDVGGFDPAYVPAYCEDVDLCLALRELGLRTVYEPRSDVVHVRFGSTDASAAAGLIEANREVLRHRRAGALARQVAPPGPHHPHREVAGRDAHAHDRVLVVADRAPRTLLLALAAAFPDGRVTVLSTGGPPDPETADELARAGVEVAFPDDLERWFGARLFHVSAAVAVGPELPAAVAELLRRTQPQAPVIESGPRPDPSAVIERLGAVGVVADAGGPRRGP